MSSRPASRSPSSNNNPRGSGNNSRNSGRPPRKWLMDRINGTSKYGERDRPDCACCYVPPPVGWCPSLLETNWFCRFWGWLGCCAGEGPRCCMLHIGFFSNLAGWILTIYACLAITEEFDLLRTTSFGRVEITEVNNVFDDVIKAYVGLRAIAIDNSVTGVGQVVVRFDQFCDLSNDGLQRYMDPADCDTCNEISSNMVISVIISAVTFLPSFFTDITRMYSGYDVNCQKCFATVFAFFSVLLSLNTAFTWIYLCGSKFYEGTIPFDADGNPLPSDAPEDQIALLLDFDWKWGYGMMMLIIGTGLKFVDVFVNFCVKTPNVTRDVREQEIYEKIKDEDF